MQAGSTQDQGGGGRILACLPLPSLEATEEVAARLASAVSLGDVLALTGDLGAGKTAFARALIHALGVVEDVPSPTFTLVQIYQPPAGPEVWHVDLYRIEDPEEVFELGLEEAFMNALCLVEWPDRLGDELPGEALELAFKITDAETGARELTLIGGDAWAARLRQVHLA